MIAIVKLKGGLGNQMFQYAFYLSLKKRHPFSWFLFDNEESKYCHFGVTLDSVFSIRLVRKNKWYNRFHKYLPVVLRKADNVVQENALQYDEKYFVERVIATRYDGYWQSEKYFSFVADTVRKSFCFSEKLMNESTVRFAQKLRSGNFVSVHVRRGDYLPLADYHGLCSKTYYHNAINYVHEKDPNAIFVFFSDDLDWVKDNLNIEGAICVDWNKEKDSWQDMFLMSQCNHNIVANSSFSWWGAWLNQHPDKLVIAPSHWFKYSPNYDIIPEGWITL